MIPLSTYYSVFQNGKVVFSGSKAACVRYAREHGGVVGITPTR